MKPINQPPVTFMSRPVKPQASLALPQVGLSSGLDRLNRALAYAARIYSGLGPAGYQRFDAQGLPADR